MSNKKCKYCDSLIDNPVDTRRFSDGATSMATGEIIYRMIMDKKFRSIDLCNYDYTLLRYYRHKDDPVIKCRGNLEIQYGMQVMEDKFRSE